MDLNLASFHRFLIRYSVVLLYLVAALPLPTLAFDHDYLEELKQLALQKQLHTDPYWYKLLHYEADKFGGGFTSLAESPNFFNAIDGEIDPKAELMATLEGFFSEENVKRVDAKQVRQCAFIARFHWLGEQLRFDNQRLPALPCSDFEDWISTIAPERVTLVFPSAYLNNPSSMFGHTFLRIDRAVRNGTSELVSYSINYAAQTDETNGVIFAYKGLTGAYPGYFSMLPYYEKVNEYNDLENRDIWEYSLNLTRPEILQMLRHGWELKGVRFEYYFLDENCSYQLLSLLQLARPDFEFTAKFPLGAAPVDTLRVVLAEQDMLASVQYRPSAQTRLRYQIGFLTDAETDLVLALVYGRPQPDEAAISAYLPRRQALMLEVAYDYLQFLHNQQEIQREQVARGSIELLKLRSRIDTISPVGEVPDPEYRPDQGHESSRLTMRLGHFEDADYAELSLRPTYHDLLDDRAGYVDGSELGFLNIDLRYTDDSGDLELQRIDFFKAVSLSPRNAFFRPNSWHLESSYERLYNTDVIDDRMVLTFNGGIGPAWRVGADATIFATLDSALWVQSKIADDFALGFGAYIGLHWPISDSWNMQLSTRRIGFTNNLHLTTEENELSFQFSLDRNTALRLNLREQGEMGESREDASIGINWYF